MIRQCERAIFYEQGHGQQEDRQKATRKDHEGKESGEERKESKQIAFLGRGIAATTLLA
ncbi:MAG: hypothetical protein V4457_11165 [Pseudomonadota bacterium]